MHRQGNAQGYAPVGAVVYCSYWREVYRVVSHNDNGTITVRWLKEGMVSKETTHRTAMGDRDEILQYLPQPCARCGWQYDEGTLDMAAIDSTRLDPQPTHACPALVCPHGGDHSKGL